MSNIGRRNSIVKRLWHSVRGRSDVEDLNNPYIIVSNFRETNEKECGKIDSRNEKKYNELLRKANKAEKTIKNSGLSMNVEVPPPPHPSNRDRYILWKKRNSVKHVIPQTKAKRDCLLKMKMKQFILKMFLHKETKIFLGEEV
jgi:hypothetical protein